MHEHTPKSNNSFLTIKARDGSIQLERIFGIVLEDLRSTNMCIDQDGGLAH